MISSEGSINNTTNMLISAPRAIKVQRELIISISEKSPTPKVAAKKLKALTIMDSVELR